jgi:LysM repeat protein
MGKNKKNILFLFLFLFTISFMLSAQIKGVPVVKLFEKEYYKYDVKPKETIFSICKRFNISETELLSMNPFISKDGLQAGQTLMIPVKKANASDKKERLSNKNNNDSLKIVQEKNKPKKIILSSVDKHRITVFLPFTPTGILGMNDRYLEFYEGFLLAVDSLKNLGLSFEVQVLESGDGTEIIRNAILTGKLDKTDCCIGGINQGQITLLADWAKENKKTLILPFTSHVPELENNPFLYQTNSPHNYMFDLLSGYSVNHFGKSSNIIFLNLASDGSDINSKLIPQIKSKLKKANKSYVEIKYDDALDNLAKVIADNRENIILPSPVSLNETSRFVTRLCAYAKQHPHKKITLLGYSEWQAMSKTYQKRLYELNTYIYSNFYVDNQGRNVRDFQISFSQTFGKSLLNTYPKYGMMGYDVAAYFIPRLVFEELGNLKNIPKIDPLQNEYQFGDKKNNSGAFNKIIYIIHYTPGNTVETKTLYGH